MASLFRVVLERRCSRRLLRALRRALRSQGAAGVLTWTDEDRTFASFSADWPNAEHEAILMVSKIEEPSGPKC